MEELLVYYAIKYQGDYNKIQKAILDNEIYTKTKIEEAIYSLQSNYITILSKHYPVALHQLDNPPYVLFYYGDIGLLNTKSITIVGMRQPSDYGQKTTKEFTEKLVKKGYHIISGMAYGIDTIAHLSCIKHQGKTIAVLGSGIDYCYPKINTQLYHLLKKEHLLISEYPNLTLPKPYYFPFRNRIVAALSKATLVTEAKKRSGTMITVGHALQLGKPVFCIPGSIYGHTGCLELIRDGAKLVITINDIIEEL